MLVYNFGEHQFQSLSIASSSLTLKAKYQFASYIALCRLFSKVRENKELGNHHEVIF